MKITKLLVRDLARLCNISYLNQKLVEEGFQNRPFTQKESVYYRCNNTPILHSCGRDSQMYVCEYKKTLTVVFRGTESLRDVLTDLNAIRVDMDIPFIKEHEKPRIHWGFYNQFNELKPELDTVIEDYIKKNNSNSNENTINDENIINEETNIIFTGHSLGGALATIAATYYSFKYNTTNISCITFGSPRVGDDYFVDLFEKGVQNSYRFVNDNDPVPCIPTAWRFKHVPGCIWLYQDQVMNEITAWRGWRFFKNYFLSFVGYGYDAVKDHSCEEYLRDLNHIPLGYFSNDENN